MREAGPAWKVARSRCVGLEEYEEVKGTSQMGEPSLERLKKSQLFTFQQNE